MQSKQPSNLLQIRVSLNYIQPPIWRKILVSDKITLLELHDVIQAVFDWQDYHLHEFEINQINYGDPANDEFGDHSILDEAESTLRTLNLTKGTRFTYVYDFGDHWKHSIVVERVLTAERGIKLPQCTDGKRARPPEDVGGLCGQVEHLTLKFLTLSLPMNVSNNSSRKNVSGTVDKSFQEKQTQDGWNRILLCPTG
ncbi:MAG: plasmid pRiA4b ORF-3 family protein [Chloroflexi bacterium]|nr:MAG: plasmid pRiA4b ORF-3 family protein [Chloroflexota bacterium]